jgi:hypothetical protein
LGDLVPLTNCCSDSGSRLSFAHAQLKRHHLGDAPRAAFGGVEADHSDRFLCCSCTDWR